VKSGSAAIILAGAALNRSRRLKKREAAALPSGMRWAMSNSLSSGPGTPLFAASMPAYPVHSLAHAILGLEADLGIALRSLLRERPLHDERDGYALALVDGSPMHEAVQPGLQGNGAHRCGDEESEEGIALRSGIRSMTRFQLAVLPSDISHGGLDLDVLGHQYGRFVPFTYDIGQNGVEGAQVPDSLAVRAIIKEHGS